jgi:catalase
MTPPERDHIVGSFSFELGKCVHPEVRERMVANLANVDTELCKRVATNLGLKAPKGSPSTTQTASAALSQIPLEPGPIAGRVVGVLAGDGADREGIETLRRVFESEGATMYVLAPRGGTIKCSDGPIAVDRSTLTTQSVEYDALVVAGGKSAESLASDPYAAVNLGEAFRHYKTIGAWGEGAAVLELLALTDALGVVTAAKPDSSFADELVSAIGWHRHWGRVAQ